MQISPALPVLAKLIYSMDEEVLTDACWAISYLSDGANEKIQAVIESGVCRRLVELLMYVTLCSLPRYKLIDIELQASLHCRANACIALHR